MARHEKDGERLDPASFRTCATAYKSMVAILVNQQAARQQIFRDIPVGYSGVCVGLASATGPSRRSPSPSYWESGYNTGDPVVAALRSVLQA